MENKKDTQHKENKQWKIKRECIERLQLRFIQVQPNDLTYFCPQDFPLESST